eukprot:1822893-Pleurochrysis_carterae.AAC.1
MVFSSPKNLEDGIYILVTVPYVLTAQPSMPRAVLENTCKALNIRTGDTFAVRAIAFYLPRVRVFGLGKQSAQRQQV